MHELHERKERLLDIFNRSPEEALREVIQRNKAHRGKSFIWCCGEDVRGVKYGSYKNIDMDDLSDRLYDVDWDGELCIVWRDAIYMQFPRGDFYHFPRTY